MLSDGQEAVAKQKGVSMTDSVIEPGRDLA